MDRFFAPSRPWAFRSVQELCFAVVFFMFGLGLLIGCLLGCLSPDTGSLHEAAASSSASSSLAGSAYKVFFYTALALLFSTSYLGVFLIPALALVRAYSFACSVAALYALRSAAGLAYAAVEIGIPALFSFPAFLACACFGLMSSFRLHSLRFGTGLRPGNCDVTSRQAAFVLVCLAAAFSYDILALPYLLSRL